MGFALDSWVFDRSTNACIENQNHVFGVFTQQLMPVRTVLKSKRPRGEVQSRWSRSKRKSRTLEIITDFGSSALPPRELDTFHQKTS